MKNFDLRKFINESKTSKDLNENIAPQATQEFIEAINNGVSIAEFVKAMIDGDAEFNQEEAKYYDLDKASEDILRAVGREDLIGEEVTTEDDTVKKSEVTNEVENVEEDAASVIGTVGASVVLTLIAKVGFDIVLGFLAKKFPEKFAKFNQKVGLELTNKYLGKDAIGDVGKARGLREEDDLQENKFKKEIQDILNS